MPLRAAEASFLLKFLSIFSCLFLLLKITPMQPLLEWIAGFEFGLLKMWGISGALNGNAIIIGSVTIEIVAECSGLFMPILLAALLWSTKISNSRRVKYLLAFSPPLFLFNLARLYITILPLAIAPAWFTPIHVFLWFLDSAIVLAIWMRAQGIGLKELVRQKKSGN